MISEQLEIDGIGMIEVYVAPVAIELVALIVVVRILLEQTAAFGPQRLLDQSSKRGFARATAPSNSQNHGDPKLHLA
jgi:hypothetical protein